MVTRAAMVDSDICVASSRIATPERLRRSRPRWQRKQACGGSRASYRPVFGTVLRIKAEMAA
jgi:hypothetical protein